MATGASSIHTTSSSTTSICGYKVTIGGALLLLTLMNIYVVPWRIKLNEKVIVPNEDGDSKRETTKVNATSSTHTMATATVQADLLGGFRGAEHRNKEKLFLPKSPLNVVLIGDSISRYQYLDLVNYFHTGRWTEDSDYLLSPKDHQSYNAFFNYTVNYFNGTMKCDCFRPYRHVFEAPSKFYENRYFSLGSNHIHFISTFGPYPAHGHWHATEIASTPLRHPNEYNVSAAKVMNSQVWEYHWVDLLAKYIPQLIPKPRYVVINAGLWPLHGLDAETLTEIHNILKANDMVGIFKTTTTEKDERNETLKAHDAAGCKIFEYCLDLSWTARANGSEYFDSKHFRPRLNHIFNKLLLNMISTIESA